MLHQHKSLNIDCSGCIECCRNEMVILHPEHGDKPSDYTCVMLGGGRWGLAQKSNGDCHYLGDGGCTIWERRPSVCRLLDCRKLAMEYIGMARKGHKLAPKQIAIMIAAIRLNERRKGKE